MNPTIRTLIVAAGVCFFALAALASFGWLPFEPNVAGVALLGFACWLASTLP